MRARRTMPKAVRGRVGLVALAFVALWLIPGALATNSGRGTSATGPIPAPAARTAAGQWTNLTANLSGAPAGSWDWRSTYDPALRAVLLFGGCQYSLQTLCRNETWAFNVTSGWVELDNGSQRSPSARQGPSMAYDPALGGVVLFGGDRLGREMSDTWEWRSGHWTDLSSVVGSTPHGRYDAEMVWDPAIRALVLFGGSSCVLSGCTSTWEFRGRWSYVTTTSAPPGRNYDGMFYDAAMGEVVVSGGQSYGNGTWHARSDTRAFDGTDWKQLRTPTAPPAEQQAVMVYDGLRGVILDVPTGTGATWVFRAGAWTNITALERQSPAPRTLPGFAMDRGDGGVVLFSGAVGVRSGGQASHTSPVLADTWIWS